MLYSALALVPLEPLLAQQGDRAYQQGRIGAIIFMVVLAGAILWSIFKKRK